MEELMDNVDPEGARLAFESLQPLLDEQSELRRANTDVDKATITAAAIGRMVTQPEVRARFAALPASDFEMVHVDRLESAALATWHTIIQLRIAEVQSSGARLPEGTLAEAAAVKQRMLRVLSYHLDDDEHVAAELTAIRSGSGYVDLASDLMRLAGLYEQNAEALAADTRHYQAEDGVTAKRLAHTMVQVLGDGRYDDAAYWSDYHARAWTLLINTYEEVSAAGRWLYRDADGESRFPSLYTVGRRRRRNPGAETESGDGEGEQDQGSDVPAGGLAASSGNGERAA